MTNFCDIKRMPSSYMFGLAALVSLCALVTSKKDVVRVVDLTHAIDQDILYWPGSDPNYDFNFLVLYREQFPDYWYEENYFSMLEHSGTHVDAPSQFNKGQWRNQQKPIERLMGPGVVINVKAKAAQDPDYRVTVADLQAWESDFGRIPDGAVVLMNSGWASRYLNRTLSFGTDTPNDPSTLHFPGFHEDAADWLTTNRNIHAVGVDTPSVDYGQSSDFSVHLVLGRERVIGVENVANLDELPEVGSTVYVRLLKLYDGSGGPARVFATYVEKDRDDDDDDNDAQ